MRVAPRAAKRSGRRAKKVGRVYAVKVINTRPGMEAERHWYEVVARTMSEAEAIAIDALMREYQPNERRGWRAGTIEDRGTAWA